MTDAFPPSETARVRLTITRPVITTTSDDGQVLEFSALGRTWRFDAKAKALLDPLLSGKAFSISELYDAGGKSLEKESMRLLLSELLQQGLITLEN